MLRKLAILFVLAPWAALAQSNVNFGALPAAPSGYQNCVWQQSGAGTSNVQQSCYVPISTVTALIYSAGAPTATCSSVVNLNVYGINTSTTPWSEYICSTGLSGYTWYQIGGGGTGTVTHTGNLTALKLMLGNGTADSTVDTVASSDGAGNLTVASLTVSGSAHGITIPAGTAVSGAAGSAIYASDSTNGYAEVNENNTGLSRVCTAANGICAGGSLTLTTTGSSGAATYSSGTLNIPIYSGGGTPGGSSTQFQYNNSGAFGGVPMTYNGTLIAETVPFQIGSAISKTLLETFAYTIAAGTYQLPAASSWSGYQAQVSDGLTQCDATTGGGTIAHVVVSNGTAWVSASPLCSAFPTTYTVGAYTMTQPAATGTLALTSQIGTWGALNYPTWVSGIPFVKMTAAGTFSLDTNTYLTTATAASTYQPLLGFTPYNATNPNGYISSSALSPYLLSATAASTYEPVLGNPGTTGYVLSSTTAGLRSWIANMVYPGAGIVVSTGSAWDTSLGTYGSGSVLLGSGAVGSAAYQNSSYFQLALTNPVTGPGSGATVGHMAVMGNTSGTSITDGGAVPTLSSLGAAASNASTTVNGQTCTLGSTCTITAGASPTSLGAITYNAAGTTTFAAASGAWVFGTVSPTASTATSLAFTGLVAGGTYKMFIHGAATAGTITWTGSASGSCTNIIVTGNGSGVFSTGGLTNEHDTLYIDFDGTTCALTLMPSAT